MLGFYNSDPNQEQPHPWTTAIKLNKSPLPRLGYRILKDMSSLYSPVPSKAIKFLFPACPKLCLWDSIWHQCIEAEFLAPRVKFPKCNAWSYKYSTFPRKFPILLAWSIPQASAPTTFCLFPTFSQLLSSSSLCTHGLCTHGLCTHGLCTHGLCTHGPWCLQFFS